MSNVIKFKKGQNQHYPEMVSAVTTYLLEEADLPNLAPSKDNVVKFPKTSSEFIFIQVPQSYKYILKSEFTLKILNLNNK